MDVFLSIDYGKRKIGLALSAGNVAVPLKILQCDGNEINNIKDIVKSERITKIILGIPTNSEGETTEATEVVIEFKNILEKNIDIPIIEFDEGLSSVQAQRMGAGSNDDAHAAALVLQLYIDSLNHDNI